MAINPPYLIKCEYGGSRVAVCAFPHPEGICFLDVGWHKEGCNPFHILEGTFRAKETPLGIIVYNDNGDSVQRLTESHPLWASWQNWLDFLGSPDGVNINQQDAIDGCVSNGALVATPL